MRLRPATARTTKRRKRKCRSRTEERSGLPAGKRCGKTRSPCEPGQSASGRVSSADFFAFALTQLAGQNGNSDQVRRSGEISKMTKLTTIARKRLPKSDFVIKGARKYPIPDAAHARDALARSSGKPEHTSVVAAVKRKFPKISIKKHKQ